MPGHNFLPILLHHLRTNQIAIGSAINQLSIWVEQRGSIDTADAVRQFLITLKLNSAAIVQALTS